MKEIKVRKPKLNIQEQIQHMKNKGILFTEVSEEEAAEFLTNHTYYFKIRSYAKNYDQYKHGIKTGQYINLEFAYIQELSRLDALIRYYIIILCLDIEHFLKVKLLNDFTSSSDDGYKIIDKLFMQYPDLKEKIRLKKNNAVCFDLIEHYEDDFAIWNIVEVLSFGDFFNLYRLFYEEYPQYDIGNVSKHIFPIKLLRNAAAHNNCLLNSLGKPYNIKNFTQNIPLNGVVSKIPGVQRTERRSKMSNPVVHDFVLLIHLYDEIVNLNEYKRKRYKELSDLFNIRMQKNAHYFQNNDVIKTTYNFVRKVVDYYTCPWI